MHQRRSRWQTADVDVGKWENHSSGSTEKSRSRQDFELATIRSNPHDNGTYRPPLLALAHQVRAEPIQFLSLS
jgi:hypothetical protein